MLLGYNTNGFAHHRLVDALTILGEIGYQSVAVTLDYHALNPYDGDVRHQLRDVRQALDKHKMRSVIETGARYLLDPMRKHQPTLLSPRREAERRLDFLRRAVDLAYQLESDAVSFWSGSAIDDASEDVHWHRLVDGCRRLCDYAEQRQVRLAFEPEPGMLIDTMPRFERLFSEIAHPLFGLTLDVGHLQCQGELPIVDHLRKWREVLRNVHVEDMKQGVHDHLAFGAGEIDFASVLRGLAEIDYRGGVHVELSRHSHRAVETARESLAFLQKTLSD